MRHRHNRANLVAPALALTTALALSLAACGSNDATSAGSATSTVTTSLNESTSSSGPPAATAGSSTTAGAASPDEQAVRDAFDGYRQAVAAKDGEQALTYVTPGSVDFFGRIRELAVTASPETLTSTDTPLAEALAAIILRVELGPQLLGIKDGRDLLVTSVNQSLDQGSVSSTSIGSVSVATATQAVGTTSDGAPIGFENQGQGWKIDLAASTQQLNGANEGQVISTLSNGQATSRAQLFPLLAQASGTTWDKLGAPLQ